MTDTSLAEVLRSPLDDLPQRRTVPAWLVFALAAVVGAAAGVIVSRSGDSTAAGPPTVPAVTTTTTLALESTTIETDDGLVFEQLGWWERGDDGVEVVLAAMARPGGAAEPIGTGAWEVELADGRTVPGLETAEAGVFTVTFEAPGLRLDDVTRLRYGPLTDRTVHEIVWEEGEVGFPWTPEDRDVLLAGEDFEVVLDEVRFDDMGGEVVWHVEGRNDILAFVDVVADYREDGERERIVTAFGLPGAFLQLGTTRVDPVEGDVTELFHLDDPEEPTFRSRFWGDPEPVDVTDLQVVWQVEVFVYADPSSDVPATISSN